MINKILNIYIDTVFVSFFSFVLSFFEHQKYKHQNMITKCLNFNRVVMRNLQKRRRINKKILNNKIVSEFISEGCS